jgi:hypothetical protein
MFCAVASRPASVDEPPYPAVEAEAAWWNGPCAVADAFDAALIPGRWEASCTLPPRDCEATPAPIAALTGVAATGCESALELKFELKLEPWPEPAWLTETGPRTPAEPLSNSPT